MALAEAWKERASKELGEVEEETEEQIKELSASLPVDWTLPRFDTSIEKTCLY